MAIQQLAVYIVTCDGCGRRLSLNGYDRFTDSREAQRVVDYLGWATHPGGRHYCPNGEHA